MLVSKVYSLLKLLELSVWKNHEARVFNLLYKHQIVLLIILTQNISIFVLSVLEDSAHRRGLEQHLFCKMKHTHILREDDEYKVSLAGGIILHFQWFCSPCHSISYSSNISTNILSQIHTIDDKTVRKSDFKGHILTLSAVNRPVGTGTTCNLTMLLEKYNISFRWCHVKWMESWAVSVIMITEDVVW